MNSRIVQYALLLLTLSLLLAGCGNSDKDGDYADRMSKEHANDTPTSNVASNSPRLPVESKEVTYATVDGTEITGYLSKAASPDTELPGIIVIHEWWGLNDNIRKMTDRLAGEGYVALAVDLYRGQVAESPEKAREYMKAAMGRSEQGISNIEQAYAFLDKEAEDDDIGVIGWCFGGGWSLQTALTMPEKIDATVIYYGRLETDKETLEVLDMPILGVFGAEDQGIPVAQVEKFEKALNDLNKEVKIEIYEGAGHAFANPSGSRYKKDAATDAWKKTVAFFNDTLKGEG